MPQKPKFYITTPLYYVNDVPHLGHVFEVIGIDVQARYRRMTGYQVTLLTGTDEHGQKIAGSAEKRGVPPQEWTDRIAAEFRRVWDLLGISYDDFIRTTEPRHHAAVAKIWNTVKAKGDIYLGKYEGWYDVKEEAFITEADMEAQGLEKDGVRIKRMAEDAYFFRLANYREQILKYIEDNPDFIQPEFRRNEVVNSFLTPDMPDLCVSRTSITWGIPVPDEQKHVVYVWFDALTNYITGAGYGEEAEKFGNLWPADVHVIGKDIVKFHCVIWPAMLFAAGIQPPKQVFGHGFITVQRDGGGTEKMSKSGGNAVSPLAYIEKIGAEPLRYLLMREINYVSDGVFSEPAMVSTYNAALPNGVGNLLARTAGLIEKNLPNGEIRPIADAELTDVERGIIAAWRETVDEYDRLMPRFEFQAALHKAAAFTDLLNQRISENAPWSMAKNPDMKDRLRVFLTTIAEGIRGIAFLLRPFMPSASDRMLASLGVRADLDWEVARQWGKSFEVAKVTKGEVLFPKVE